MITGIGSSSEYIYASGGNRLSYPNIQVQNPIPGSVKMDYNGFHIYDGYTWHRVPDSYANIDFSNQGREIMEWANKKMQEEQEIFKAMEEAVKMAETNPTVADALESYKQIKEEVKNPQKQAWEKLQAVMALCKEENQ